MNQPVCLTGNPQPPALPTPAPSVIRWIMRFRMQPWLIRLRHWEYWPFPVVYFPVFCYWLWLSLRARSFFFFSAANPSIETGGMLGESKGAILDRIDSAFKPRTLLVKLPASAEAVLAEMGRPGIRFPIIAKPNIGERGWRVEKIDDAAQLRDYIRSSPIDFLIQDYVDLPLELGVFYYRFPGEPRGVVSSIVRKEFLSVTGDGHSTLQELIEKCERARLQLDTLRVRYRGQLGQVLARGENKLLVPIGNHSRGTKFLDASHLITSELTAVFDRISQSVEGFYYGRYDLRCASVEDLYAGRNIRIVELNGAGAEPAHIYQPGFSLWKAYRVLFHHWRVLYQISRENRRRGITYLSLREAYAFYRKMRNQAKMRTQL